MDTFRKLLPSKQQVVLLFASCTFPVYSWSVVVFFKRMRGWLFYLDPWDVAGMFAYTQAAAFLESVGVLLVLILLGAILPARFLRDRFVTQGSALVLMTSGWAIAAQCAHMIPFTSFARWHSKRFLLGAVLYLASISMFYVMLRRHKCLEEVLNSFVERLVALLYMYVPLTVLSVVIIVFRNTQEGM